MHQFSTELHVLPPSSTPLRVFVANLELQQTTTRVLQTIEEMRNGTWTSPQPANSFSYESTPTRVEQTYLHFLRRNVSTIVSQEVEKFNRLLLGGNVDTMREATPIAIHHI